MTVETRKPKMLKTRIREVFRSNSKHRIYSVISPTSDKPYQVITDWSIADSVVTINCKLFSFEAQYGLNHPANYSNQICCQFLASIKWAASQAGMSLSLPQDGEFASAVRLLNFGGKLVRIVNQIGQEAWGIVR